MSYLIRFCYFLLVLAIGWAGLKWEPADAGLREEWHSGLSATPPSGFSYAYVPRAPAVLQHIGKPRVVLVTQQELESELVGAYGTDGTILKFPLSSFTPLDANQYDQSLVDAAADVYKKWNNDKYPYSMKLSFDRGMATFTHRSRDIQYKSRYQVETPLGTVRALSYRSYSLRHAATASAPVFLITIVCVPLALPVGDRVIRVRAAKKQQPVKL